MVTPSLFPLLGMSALIGRTFLPEEETADTIKLWC